jgi:hypothetical protein
MKPIGKNGLEDKLLPTFPKGKEPRLIKIFLKRRFYK